MSTDNLYKVTSNKTDLVTKKFSFFVRAPDKESAEQLANDMDSDDADESEVTDKKSGEWAKPVVNLVNEGEKPARNESVDQALLNTHNLLTHLLDSAALDPGTESRITKEMFDHYEWKMKNGEDEARFEVLLHEGRVSVLSDDDLNEFIDMVCPNGQYDTYFLIRRALQRVKLNRDMIFGVGK